LPAGNVQYRLAEGAFEREMFASILKIASSASDACFSPDALLAVLVKNRFISTMPSVTDAVSALRSVRSRPLSKETNNEI
jgi:ABC-type hemin transport system substrate-binding protein